MKRKAYFCSVFQNRALQRMKRISGLWSASLLVVMCLSCGRGRPNESFVEPVEDTLLVATDTLCEEEEVVEALAQQ